MTARATHPRAFVLALALIAGVPASAAPQTILGRVLDQTNEEPIGGAVVTLMGRDGAERVRELTDSAGRFRLVPPQAGEYVLKVERFGYNQTLSPLIALGLDGTASVDLMMTPEPIGIEGVDVSVEVLATEELQQFGLTPRALGDRWIDRTKIEAIPLKRDIGTILERAVVTGTRIIRPENLNPGGDDMGLCVSFARARTAAGSGRCAMIVLNGIPIGGHEALALDPDAIESIAILDPVEATTHFGTRGGGGAVLVWTGRGR